MKPLSREEVIARVTHIVSEQLGVPVGSDTMIREALGATSLDMASMQIGFEEEFALVFGAGSTRLPIDEAWEQAKTVEAFADMVLRFLPQGRS